MDKTTSTRSRSTLTKVIEGCIDKHKRTMFHMAAMARLITIEESG
jgi:hypothetical protein